MRTMPAELVELDDATTWIRHGGRMLQLDLNGAGFLVAAHGEMGESGKVGGGEPVNPALVVAPRVRKALPAPKPAPTAAAPKRRGRPPKVRAADEDTGDSPEPYTRKGPSAAVQERARRMLEEEGRSVSSVAEELDKSGATIYGWIERFGWVLPSRIVKARKLVEEHGYSPKRAAAAEKIPLARLEAALADAEEQAQISHTTGRAGIGTRVTGQEQCPTCRQLTKTNPCHHCLERR